MRRGISLFLLLRLFKDHPFLVFVRRWWHYINHTFLFKDAEKSFVSPPSSPVSAISLDGITFSDEDEEKESMFEKKSAEDGVGDGETTQEETRVVSDSTEDPPCGQRDGNAESNGGVLDKNGHVDGGGEDGREAGGIGEHLSSSKECWSVSTGTRGLDNSHITLLNVIVQMLEDPGKEQVHIISFYSIVSTGSVFVFFQKIRTYYVSLV
mgnify:CR=1 FL=1